MSDSAAGLPLLTTVAAAQPTSRAWADSAYRTTVIDGAAEAGIDVEVVTRNPDTRGFTPLPRRWAAERTLGRLMLGGSPSTRERDSHVAAQTSEARAPHT
ncbi:hypothetical protein [Nonomuraea sp. NPDC049709]|uniref:hypothetical protein n=1 Tax=Nonomuraea sp. NPDC049709 TaxID=3154736 RepID=UPI0034346367